ncbi:MAG TPA: interleukin-like EMT inducer domain-containing protein [Thermoanaerobaculia bacterium]|nr:interleukin-like EMT inducer domain-containing protein [Thermoanaerobaculia bacterium]
MGHRIVPAVLAALLGFTGSASAFPGPSLVSVSGRRLVVQKRQPDGNLAAPEIYVIHGVNWSPASSGTTGDEAARRAEMVSSAASDAALLQSLHVNTVRTYLDPGLDAAGLSVLDELWARGIMVVLTVDRARSDLTRVQQVVSLYKDHPAVLLWSLGNEWNINLYYGNGQCNSPLAAAQCTETAAQLVKSLDTNHPVSTNYGEIDINADGLRLADTQNYVNNVAPSVDVWSLNIFRAETFGTLFEQWRSISSKPMFLGEFGTDALMHPINRFDDTMQAGWDLCLWNDAIRELSATSPALASLGGLVFEWNDEWWKVFPSGSHDAGGFANANGHPDGYANEEWFGIVDVDRNLRHAATALGQAFESTYQRPPRGLILSVGSRGANAAQYDGQYGYSRFYHCGRAFYNKNGGGGGGRGISAVVLDPRTGNQIAAPQTFDTYITRSACAANDPSAQMYALVAYLNAAPTGSLILLSVADEAGLNQDLSCNPFSTSSCFQNGLSALEALGSTQIHSYCFRDSWAMIAVKGKGLVAESLSKTDRVSLQTPLPDPGPADFFTVTPCRVLDTRTGSGPLASGTSFVFEVAGSCGVPATARAVSLNVTVFAPPASGNVNVFPGDELPPPTSTLNFASGLTRANHAILPLSSDGNGSLAIRPSVSGGGAVHVIVDVDGYFE